MTFLTCWQPALGDIDTLTEVQLSGDTDMERK